MSESLPSRPLEALVLTRGPVMRALIGLVLLCGVALALASGIVLNGYALVLVVIAAAVASSVAYVMTAGAGDGARSRSIDAAWKAAVGTVSLILVVAGLVVLAGGAVALAVIGLAVVAGGVGWLLRAWRAQHARRDARAPAAGNGGDRAAILVDARLNSQPPVARLSTAALGREWLWTTTALGRRLEPGLREAVVKRRQEILDELEHRDAAGLGRWLANGAAVASDPASFVRNGPQAGPEPA